MTLHGISQAVRAFASVSRYYPQIVRYYLFFKDMQKIEETPFAKVREGDFVILGTLPTGEDVMVKTGERVALVSIERMRDLQYALLNARLVEKRGPLETVVLDPTKPVSSKASLALVSSYQIGKDGELPPLPEAELRDKVALIVYQPQQTAGAFGETHVLTSNEGTFERFALLGTPEADAALKEIAARAAALRRMKRGIIDADEEDDEDEDI
jgi:hypothetical protein